MKIRKKPVVIEATKFMGGLSVDEMRIDWGQEFSDSIMYIDSMNILEIKTLEGVMRANIGDYVIKGVAGEFYPCKPEIFEKSYEVVAEAQTNMDDEWKWNLS